MLAYKRFNSDTKKCFVVQLLFSNALKPKCGLEVQIREPETIEEAYKIASKFEANFNKPFAATI